jgi:hypothetical protein
LVITAANVTFESDAFVVRLSNDLRHDCVAGSTLEIDKVGDITATDPAGLEWEVVCAGWLDIAFVGDRVITNRRQAQRHIR